MTEKNCLIVRAAGRQLDLLRGEASRIAKGTKVDWWIDRTDIGVQFCFENSTATEAFGAACTNLGIEYRETQRTK